MNSKKIQILIVGALTVIAIVAFSVTLVRALLYAPDTEVPGPPPGEELTVVVPEDYPERLFVPELDIDANVQHVGVNAKGNMANPDNFTDVGWYKYGAVPGYRGSAVMAGHLDNGLALNGVFKRLDELAVSDDIYVETAGGERLHFVVEEVMVYNYLQAPLQKLFERGDRARLNLVTCEGTWVKSAQTYDQRRIVYAVLADS